MRSAKDMHVAACAHALIVGGYYPQATRPDAFLLDLFRRDAHGVAAAFATLRATLR
jgi:hypothetical protein